jgi:hypothetical protein
MTRGGLSCWAEKSKMLGQLGIKIKNEKKNGWVGAWSNGQIGLAWRREKIEKSYWVAKEVWAEFIKQKQRTCKI